MRTAVACVKSIVALVFFVAAGSACMGVAYLITGTPETAYPLGVLGFLGLLVLLEHWEL